MDEELEDDDDFYNADLSQRSMRRRNDKANKNNSIQQNENYFLEPSYPTKYNPQKGSQSGTRLENPGNMIQDNDEFGIGDSFDDIDLNELDEQLQNEGLGSNYDNNNQKNNNKNQSNNNYVKNTSITINNFNINVNNNKSANNNHGSDFSDEFKTHKINQTRNAIGNTRNSGNNNQVSGSQMSKIEAELQEVNG